MLRKDSNIINFQNRFEIFDEGETGTDFIECYIKQKQATIILYPRTLLCRLK